jgi:dTDP-L-rhamnose 4-epimerase
MAVNVGTGRPTSVMQVAQALKQRYSAASNLSVSGRFRAGDIRHASADVQRLRECIGFVPETSFESGIDGFCRWASGELEQLGDGGGDSYRRSLHELEQLGLMGRAQAGTSRP